MPDSSLFSTPPLSSKSEALVVSLRRALVLKKELDVLDDRLLAKIPEIEAALWTAGLRIEVSAKVERVTPERVIEFQTYRDRPVKKRTIPAFHVPLGFLWWRKFGGQPREAIQEGPWRLVFENTSGNLTTLASTARETRVLCFHALLGLAGAFLPKMGESVEQRKELLARLTGPEK